MESDTDQAPSSQPTPLSTHLCLAQSLADSDLPKNAPHALRLTHRTSVRSSPLSSAYDRPRLSLLVPSSTPGRPPNHTRNAWTTQTTPRQRADARQARPRCVAGLLSPDQLRLARLDLKPFWAYLETTRTSSDLARTQVTSSLYTLIGRCRYFRSGAIPIWATTV